MSPKLDKPNIIVLGVPHSGTRILAYMLFELGWDRVDAIDPIAESQQVRRINKRYGCPSRLGTIVNTIEPYRIERALRALGGCQPWVIKDPRFCMTLDQWVKPLESYCPVLLIWLIRENIDYHTKSFQRRKYYKTRQSNINIIKRYAKAAAKQYTSWPWAKVQIKYEDMIEAVKLFDVTRQPLAIEDEQVVVSHD